MQHTYFVSLAAVWVLWSCFPTSYLGTQVSRTGKDTDYSSEEEEEAKRADTENRGLLDLQGSIEGDITQVCVCLTSPLEQTVPKSWHMQETSMMMAR